MMYSNKLAIAVKAGGKVLREFDKDTVYVPFGSEYTLLIKNLNSVRAQVRIEIDGNDATEGTWLVINPNSEVEVERFIKNGNLAQGNRFRFIERTAAVENGPRGIGVEDGLIRIEYQFEKPAPMWLSSPRERWVKKEYWEKEPYYFGDQLYTTTFCSDGGGLKSIVSSPLRSMSTNAVGSAFLGHSTASSMLASAETAMAAPAAQSITVNATLGSASSTVTAQAAPVNDAGITVPGSVSDQRFSTVMWFPVEETKHVMVIKLLGETTSGQAVQQPVTVKAKPKCTTCGHTNKATAKFCSECGTSLVLL